MPGAGPDRSVAAPRGAVFLAPDGMAARSARRVAEGTGQATGPEGSWSRSGDYRERAAAQRERRAAATAQAGGDDPRYPKKSLRAAGDPPEPAVERRRRMRAAVETLAPTVGLAPACRALGVARASVYRHRKSLVPKAPFVAPTVAVCVGATGTHAGVGHAPRRSVSWTEPLRRCTPPCWRRGGICVRSARCIGCCTTPTK